MIPVARIVDVAARKAWIWRNRKHFSASAAGQPRLLVDVSAIIRHDAQTGIQRVVRAVWLELARRNGRNFIAQPVYATSRQGYCYAPLDFLDRRSRALNGVPASLGPGDVFLGLDLSAHLLPKYVEQLRTWRRSGANISLIVYDLLPLERPDWFTEAAGRHFRRWFQLLSDEVDNAICISDSVASRLKSMLFDTSNGPTISRLLMGTDMSASRPSRGLSHEVVALVHKMRELQVVLMVGTIEPRKGYEAALNAFEYLWRTFGQQAPSLVIVGKAGWKTAALQVRLRTHPEWGKRLHWLEGVSDEALSLLYDEARGVLITSYGEGFGLPLVEASRHKRYVLARDLEVFREQGLPNVLYFNDDDAALLGAQIMVLTQNNSAEITQAKLPTWNDAVDRLLGDLTLAAENGSPEKSLRWA